jgi:hypothetical protein
MQLTLLAAGLGAAFMLVLPSGSGARAEEGQGAATPTPPATGGCPYRGGKRELIA